MLGKSRKHLKNHSCDAATPGAAKCRPRLRTPSVASRRKLTPPGAPARRRMLHVRARLCDCIPAAIADAFVPRPSSFSELLRRHMTARPSVNPASFRPMNRWRFLPGSDTLRLAGQRPAPGTCRHSRMASPVLGATLSISIAGRYAGRRCDGVRRMGRKLLRSGERPRARRAERPGGDRARAVMNVRPWRERIASWTTSPRAGRPPLRSMT